MTHAQHATARSPRCLPVVPTGNLWKGQESNLLTQYLLWRALCSAVELPSHAARFTEGQTARSTGLNYSALLSFWILSYRVLRPPAYPVHLTRCRR